MEELKALVVMVRQIILSLFVMDIVESVTSPQYRNAAMGIDYLCHFKIINNLLLDLTISRCVHSQERQNGRKITT